MVGREPCTLHDIFVPGEVWEVGRRGIWKQGCSCELVKPIWLLVGHSSSQPAEKVSSFSLPVMAILSLPSLSWPLWSRGYLGAEIRQSIRTNPQDGSRFLLEKGMKSQRRLERWLRVLTEGPGLVPTKHLMAGHCSWPWIPLSFSDIRCVCSFYMCTQAEH